LRNKELNIEDLQTILYWYTKAFENNDEETKIHKNTLIKVQAMSIYAEEDEKSSTDFIRRRMR
jgi:hypothetical protein